MKNRCFLLFLFLLPLQLNAQAVINLDQFHAGSTVKVYAKGNILSLKWPAGKAGQGILILDLDEKKPLFKNISLQNRAHRAEIAADLDPAFILTIGKRKLDPKFGGWDIFFDNVRSRPFHAYTVALAKVSASVSTAGSHTVVKINELHAGQFKGTLEITLYNGSPLFNVAAVMSTERDSTAIVYDAGLVSKDMAWQKISWCDTTGSLKNSAPVLTDTSRNLPVRYRTVIGVGSNGSLALFPAPHQYFYPLDEAFNLKFTWYGNNYRGLLPGFGLGIRQDLQGDRRYVPWFNARPNAKNRLNFFCLLSAGNAGAALNAVKKFTHGDGYPPLPGYQTMQSHFHNEFTMNVVLKGLPVPKEPGFIKVFKGMGVNIVHLAEFHIPGHPKGPDSVRITELKALFEQCSRLSEKNFLLLPGEEVNNFYGGHWLALFPKPVFWVMSKATGVPFIQDVPGLGKYYHVGDKDDMFKLLEQEHGIAWTAHARTKGSVGYPDGYRNEPFYRSGHFMGGAWKNIPADLSTESLSRRVLDLMDETSNWGLKKYYIGECDIFSMKPANETYAHVNVNYLKLQRLPSYKDGWQPILQQMNTGKFFTTTGEVLIPSFSVNGKTSGQTAQLDQQGNATVKVSLNWTFPLNYLEIISGDGQKVYRKRVGLKNTEAFGSKTLIIKLPLKSRKWARLEAWDIAVNGAFTQNVWLKN